MRANGHTIGYRSFGRGTPVVLIEGYGASIDDWDPRFADQLARSHRVVELDNRGIGRSGGSVASLTIRTLAEDAAALISRLGLRHPTVLGHSMGGEIAQELALHHRRLLARLVLVASPANGAGGVLPEPSVLGRLIPPFDWRKNLDLFFSTPAAGRAYVRSCDRRPRRERVSLTVERAQLAALSRWLAEDDAWLRLPSLRVPTLVTLATNDPLVPQQDGEHLARRIPGAHLVRFRYLRHAFFMQDPDRFVRTVDSFIASH